MKNKKYLIGCSIAFILVLCLTLILNKSFMTNDKKVESNDKNVKSATLVENPIPLISSVCSYWVDMSDQYAPIRIEVDAGMYRYGDITQDGEINLKDITGIKVMLANKNAGFTSDQIDLANFDRKNGVNINDLNALNSYYKGSNIKIYTLNKTLLEYCFSTKNDYSKCNWDDSPSIEVDNLNADWVSPTTYYIFARNTKTKKVSKVFKHTVSTDYKCNIQK